MNAAQLDALIDALNARAAPAPQPRKKLADLTSADPTDWLTWRDHFEEVRGINGWVDDARIRREIAAAVMGEPKLLLRDIPTGADAVPVQPYTELLNAYEARLMPQAASDLARTRVREAKQNEDETLTHWHARCRQLFIRAYPGLAAADLEINRDLIDIFARGLLNPTVRRQTMRTRAATYALAFQAASNETACEEEFNPSAAVKKEPGIQAMSRGGAKGGRGGRGGTSRTVDRSIICHRCGNRGHYKRDCYTKMDTDAEGAPRAKRGRGSQSSSSKGAASGGKIAGRFTAAYKNNIGAISGEESKPAEAEEGAAAEANQSEDYSQQGNC
jgi:hypothetical protein